MKIHNFNTEGNSTYLLNEHGGASCRIARGELPDGLITVSERAIYVPENAGNVTVETESACWRTAAPLVVVQGDATDVRITVDGNPEDVYTLEACELTGDFIEQEKAESPPGIFMDLKEGVVMYTRENRFFKVDGVRRESGWYVHSLKAHGRGTRNVFGISDAKWEAGVRDGEQVHYHVNSLEPLVVLEGAAIMLVEVEGRYYSFKQEPGVISVPDKGQVHGILQVEASPKGVYRHMCAQGPSKFHDLTDRVVVTGAGFSTGKTRDYMETHGIPERLLSW